MGMVQRVAEVSRLVYVGGKFLGTYEWAAMEVYYSPDQEKFFWYADHGNSMNSFGDRVQTIWDFENGDKDDVLRAIRRFGDNYTVYDYGAKDAVSDLWKDVWDFRPEKAVAPTGDAVELKDGETFDYGVVYRSKGGKHTYWGLDDSVTRDVVNDRGKVYLAEYDAMPVKVDAVVRRVIGKPEVVWGSDE